MVGAAARRARREGGNEARGFPREAFRALGAQFGKGLGIFLSLFPRRPRGQGHAVLGPRAALPLWGTARGALRLAFDRRTVFRLRIEGPSLPQNVIIVAVRYSHARRPFPRALPPRDSEFR